MAINTGANSNQNAGVRQTVSSIIERLPVSKTHKFIVIVAALGFMFDSFDTYILSYAMPSIVKEWAITPVQNGVLTSAGFWGMMVGAFIWGPITDKIGRKPGFIATVLGFSILTGITAFTQNFNQFLVLRFLTGWFLGGMIPIDTALVSEYVSSKIRGRFIAVLPTFWPFGLLAAAISAMFLVPTYGWRSLFIVGVIPAFLSFIVRSKVPESPRWLANKGRQKETGEVLKSLGATDEDVNNLELDKVKAEKVSLAVLLQPQYIKRFIMTAGYYMFGYFGYYGFQTWLPTIFVTVYGLTLAKTFTYTFFIAISAILGRMTAFYLIDKAGRKPLFYIGFGLGGIAAVIFGLIKNPDYLVYCACALSYVIEIGMAGTVIWTAELYPSHIRATATSWSTLFGRISSALAPIIFGFFIASKLYFGVFLSIAIAWWITLLLVFIFGVETKGKTLDEIGAA